jgi:hypothetical protein
MEIYSLKRMEIHEAGFALALLEISRNFHITTASLTAISL